jgi:hypothetical protein
MAHFAKLDADNKVIHVSVVDNSVIRDDHGNENEQLGIEYLTNIHGYSKWKQTSYHGTFRKNYAGIGFTYDENRDAFVPPNPYKDWILNEETCNWHPPIPMPSDTSVTWVWDHDTHEWKDALDYIIEQAEK